jgi:hypothetical protein
MSVLAIDSTFEELTQAASDYREQIVYPYLAARGYSLHQPLLQGPLATRGNAAPAASDPSVTYLTGVGHGTYLAFRGDFNEEVFSVGYYDPQEVNGKIAHFFSCDVAKTLGPDFVHKGCSAFFGYDELFVIDPQSREVFFECDAEIDMALADGLTAAAVLVRARGLFDQRIQELQTAGNIRGAQALQSNRDHLRQLGDATATLKP